MNDSLVLASASPRRLQLLQQMGLTCDVLPVDLDESTRANEDPADYVARLAREKSAACQALIKDLRPVLAADTSVVLDDQILGKPTDHFDALAMLARLSGREHRVLTAVCLRSGAEIYECLSETLVQFVVLNRDQCEAYLATDEPWDKAGAYGIQGRAGAFVERIVGSYSGVVGLPLAQTWQLLQDAGISTGLDGIPRE